MLICYRCPKVKQLEMQNAGLYHGLRQSRCGIYLPSIVPSCPLRGRLLQQHLVLMGEHLLLHMVITL
uniref:Transducin family protein n=1 Tax=Rhizophora mucronata TaxID=61149 RepID=A0A2P2JDW7_RHIMU